MTTSADIVNRALAQIAAEYTVTGTPPTFDGSAAGLAAGTLYNPAWQMLLRQQDAEFARRTVPLTLTGNVPLFPWQFEYLYPNDCLKVRSIQPRQWDPNDPQAIRWWVSDDPVAGEATRVILCNVEAALLTYSTSNVTENQWDVLFQESMARYLASELSMPVAGRPDFSRVKLAESGQILESADAKDS